MDKARSLPVAAPRPLRPGLEFTSNTMGPVPASSRSTAATSSPTTRAAPTASLSSLAGTPTALSFAPQGREVVHDRQAIGLDGGRDARDDHVRAAEPPLLVEGARRLVEVHLHPQWIEHAHPRAAQAGGLHQPACRVDAGLAAEDGDVH